VCTPTSSLAAAAKKAAWTCRECRPNTAHAQALEECCKSSQEKLVCVAFAYSANRSGQAVHNLFLEATGFVTAVQHKSGE
jgi:hypothetical protein